MRDIGGTEAVVMRFIQIGQKGDYPGKLVGPDHGFLAK